MSAQTTLAETAITVGAPLVINLFQHIFDALHSHAPSDSTTSKKVTAVQSTTSTIKQAAPGGPITEGQVLDIINAGIADGTIQLPAATMKGSK